MRHAPFTAAPVFACSTTMGCPPAELATPLPVGDDRERLIIAVYGGGEGEDPSVWATALLAEIEDATDAPTTWQTLAYDWSALSENCALAPNAAAGEGVALGAALLDAGYTHVHFVAHSVGCILADAAVTALGPADARAMTVHATLFDPFGFGPVDYAADADFTEVWLNTDDGTPGSDDAMPSAFTIDATAARPAAFDDRAHGWPIDAWRSTVPSRLVPGFGFSAEASGFAADLHTDYPRGELVTS